MKAVKRTAAALAAIMILFIGIFIYRSYFYYTEGRNGQQNSQALHLSVLMNSALADPEYGYLNEDMIISNDKKLGYNNNFSEDIQAVLDKMSSLSGISFDKGIYYIEVRNKEVYRVIYAKWKYSGYVGTSPEPNPGCKIFRKEAERAAEEFNEYLKTKE